jgi:hypothetical protein
MSLNWGEIKQQFAKQGITDDTKIASINLWLPDYHDDLTLYLESNRWRELHIHKAKMGECMWVKES